MFNDNDASRLLAYLKSNHPLYLSIFKGRDDIVAKRWEFPKTDGKNSVGYSPICSNRYDKNLCPLAQGNKANCPKCENKSYHGITPGLLDKHFNGQLYLGCYPLQSDTTTWFVAADFDNHDPDNNPRDPLADVQSLVPVARKYGVPLYVLSSRSGKGFHAYLFFDEAVSAGLARGVILGMLAEAGVDVQKKKDGKTEKEDSYDRLFPSQDKHTGAGYGNLIGMPFQGEVLPKGCTVFIDPESGQAFPVDEQINMLNSIQRIGTNALKALPQAPDEIMTKTEKAQNAELLPAQPKRKAKQKLPPSVGAGSRNETLFRTVCAWINQGMDESTILDAAKSENQLKFTPPLDDSEVESLVTHACARYSKQHLQNATAPTLVPVRVMMDDAPCHEDAVIPANFELSKNCGVQILEPEAKQLIFTPLLFLKRLKNTATPHEDVLIAWWRDGKWNPQVLSRETLANSSKILILSNFGIPISSNTAAKLISYLTAYETENQANIPIINVTNTLGWQLDMNAFLAGNLLITQNGFFDANVGNACNQSDAQSNLPVVFKGKDVGDTQLADAFSKNGTYDGWVSAINETYAYPYVFGNILAAFSTPLLAILGAQNFIIDTAFTTSRGKTTTLRGAASVWGNPSGIGSTLLQTWNNTDVWIGRAAATLNDLPLILDDTKLAADGHKSEVGKKVSGTLYKIASGRDRGRGSLDGTRITDTWRTVLLSTGEQSAVDFTDGDGGTRARVISIWGAPFGDGNNAEIVKRFTDGVTRNFGHAGPRFIKFLLDHKNDWSTWRDAYDELKIHYAALAGLDPVANRMSAHFATLAMTATLVHAALPELKPTQPIREIINAIFAATKMSFEEADRSKSALKSICEWTVSNQNKFWRDSDSDDAGKPYEPHGGWAGRWDQGKTWTTIDFVPAYLKTLLVKEGYDAPAIIKAWGSRGWLKTEGESHQRSTRLNGKKIRVYSIKRETLQELGLSD